MTEIRWHGRGGQGAKTVSQLMAMAFKNTGYFVQAFPEYGPERSGAPMQAYTRSSEKRIRLHCAVTNPDAVVVLDDSLIGEINILEGLESSGLALLNTSIDNENIKKQLAFDGELFSVDGNRLSKESGVKYANVVVAGALAAVLGIPSLEHLKEAAVEVFEEKLNQSLIDKNLRAIELGYKMCNKIQI